ncbi:pleckstrin homology domain-containing family S member 1 isoform X2 [Rhineura floridana]|nr:pleckstrin homology domain-containing family S member 1 isoform X2 [Rhineura floridana]XP_061490371.1 pleckstrin homology domain-containing family S member 1 isoform X2 [Rhineura floridana]
MDSPRSISIGRYNYEDVYKHGFFIKSPPPHLFTNQTSWKRRYFILSKFNRNDYVLKYLKGHQLKGLIEISETSEIEIGIGDPEKMTAVKKMFKCQPTEVMTIRTENRVFYLIGTDCKEIEEWATFLFSACRDTKKLEMRSRPKSSPACLDELGAAAIMKKDMQPCNEYEDIGASTVKKRPSSDPTLQETAKEIPVYESPAIVRLRCLTNQQSKEKSKIEEYYASPSNILAQLDNILDEYSTSKETTNPDDEKADDNKEYMTMKDVQEHSMNPLVAENKPLKPTPLPRSFKLEKTPKPSFLSVVQLSIILSKITDESKLEEVDILLPRDDFTDCLTLTEAVGHICVSQWKDLHHFGCIFHQGDYIVAVNDLHVKSMDEISLFISRSTRKEVKLSVCRLPNSELLHAQGCKCS